MATTKKESFYNFLKSSELVAQGPSGRWFITIGNRGFNTRANNGAGYATKEAALKVTLGR